MREDRFRYTKFGLVNALLSLIPIFPTWTLFPGMLFGTAAGSIFDNCELGYSITLWTCFGLMIFLLFRYFSRFDGSLARLTEQQSKENFRFFSLQIYTLLNTAVLILIIGTDLACYGDGQTILACILSGPIASVGLILLGAAVDIKVKIAATNSI